MNSADRVFVWCVLILSLLFFGLFGVALPINEELNRRHCLEMAKIGYYQTIENNNTLWMPYTDLKEKK